MQDFGQSGPGDHDIQGDTKGERPSVILFWYDLCDRVDDSEQGEHDTGYLKLESFRIPCNLTFLNV